MRAPDGRRDLVTSSKEIAHRLDKSSPSGFTRGLDACSLTTGAQAVSSPIVSTASEPRSAETSIRLKDQGKDLIERTLGSCGGNVSKTAELLGVSRGLIYRRLSGPKRSAR
jgi:transcriptional regulator of acetoin/glycerol metabolism